MGSASRAMGMGSAGVGRGSVTGVGGMGGDGGFRYFFLAFLRMLWGLGEVLEETGASAGCRVGDPSERGRLDLDGRRSRMAEGRDSLGLLS